MQRAVESRLWDEGAGYLVNFNGTEKDTHYYMGSLVGAAFGLLSPGHAQRMVTTASRVLVDPLIGVRTVMPADFQTDSARAYFKFVDNEAGDPYLYLNGAVWAHDNAWYALALREIGRADDALRFCRQTMTVDGTINSPMGQPAMYEYRFSDTASADYGWIDKPSFLWAGGFYLYTLYHLLGVDEHEWNLSIAGPAPAAFDSTVFSFSCGALKSIEVTTSEEHARRITADGSEVPSRVIPLALGRSRHLKVVQGKTVSPRLESLNAILHSASYDGKAGRLKLECSSFDGHPVIAVVGGIRAPKMVTLDRKRVAEWSQSIMPDGSVRVDVRFSGTAAPQTLIITY